MSGECGNDCAEALRRLEEYLDGELSRASVQDVSRHLAECYPCADRASFEEHLRAVVRGGCADQAPPALVARVRARLDRMTADVGEA